MCSEKQLTAKQRETIECMVEHKDWDYSRIAEEMGIHRNALYKWRQTKAFTDALDKELHRVFKEGSRIALETLLNLAKEGDRQAAIYILDNGGYKVADQVEIGTTNDIQIKITND